MRWLLWVLAPACSFGARSAGVTHDAPVNDTRGDGPAEAAPDAPLDCMPRWLGHTVSFGQPASLDSVNSLGYERDPFLTGDEKTIYFSSIRADSLPIGNTDIYVATRTALTDSFGLATKFLAASTTDGFETKVSFTSDGNDLIVGSTQVGGDGGVDAWEAVKTTTFGALTESHLAMVNDGGNQQDPVMSPSGLHLYLAPDTSGRQQLVMATRSAVTASFGAPMTLTELDDATFGTADPALSPDERVIVFSSGRTGTLGGGDLWYATRAGSSGTFSTPLPVPVVNTAANEGDPHLSSDGCRLYFSSDRNAGSDPNNWDLFVAAQP